MTTPSTTTSSATTPEPVTPSSSATVTARAPVGPESDLAADRSAAFSSGRRLSAGTDFACALDGAGSASCWGPGWGAEVSGGPFVAIAAGAHHACALGEDHHVRCWGSPDYAVAEPADELWAIDAAGGVTCGLRGDMTPLCWGNDDSGRLEAPAERLRSLDVEDPTSCGLRADGTLLCWGLGASDSSHGDSVYESFSTGQGLLCGRLASGALRCTGYASSHTELPSTPLVALFGGRGGLCGLDAAGMPSCFGFDRIGRPPAPPAAALTTLVAGRTFACGITASPAGELTCWGLTVTLPPGPFVELAAGERFGCARASDGRVECFGAPYFGQARAPEGRFRAVAAGTTHTCAIQADGALTCFGHGAAVSSQPAGRFVAIASGLARSCAIDEHDALACWGAETRGNPPLGRRVRSVAMADHLECAVLASGTLACWGGNAQELDVAGVRGATRVAVDDGAVIVETARGLACFAQVFVARDRPRAAASEGMAGPTWAAVDCPLLEGTPLAVGLAGSDVVALAADGALVHGRGPLDGMRLPPRPAATLEPGPFSALSVRELDRCAIARDDGHLQCWGADGLGQASPPPGRFTAVSVGAVHACGIREDGALVCWGAAPRRAPAR